MESISSYGFKVLVANFVKKLEEANKLQNMCGKRKRGNKLEIERNILWYIVGLFKAYFLWMYEMFDMLSIDMKIKPLPL
jgi:hypothetical protein